MQIGITMELMSPMGSVAFQSQVEVQDESIRSVRKELNPGQSWTWRLAIPRDRIAVFAAQSMLECEVSFNGKLSELTLEGQSTTDFGIIFARRGQDTFGALPFEGDLVEMVVKNTTDKLNRIDVFVGELPDQIDE